MISAKLKLPKEVSFASPGLPLPHFPFFSYLSRTSLWFGVLLVPATSLPPANQPTKQPRASLMLLLRISGRLLGCQPAGTIGRCVSPLFLPFFFLPPSLYPPPPSSAPRPSPPRVYILFYVTLFHYLSHFLGIPPRVRDNRRKWGGNGEESSASSCFEIWIWKSDDPPSRFSRKIIRFHFRVPFFFPFLFSPRRKRESKAESEISDSEILSGERRRRRRRCFERADGIKGRERRRRRV